MVKTAALLALASWPVVLAAQETAAARPADKATAAAGVERPAERLPTDVRRLTILVRNMENSLKLYRDVMGLSVNYDQNLTVSGVALPAGVPGNKVRLVLLNGNDPFVGWIGLMEYTDPPLEADDPYPKRLKAGGHVLILDTSDVERRCEMAKTVPGVQFTAEVREQRYPGRGGGPEIVVKGCNFFDPDGLLVEMNQIVSQ
jgi:catechol 2,3-dioxygenase-like lactoylglutathione lyase family enzyme